MSSRGRGGVADAADAGNRMTGDAKEE